MGGEEECQCPWQQSPSRTAPSPCSLCWGASFRGLHHREQACFRGLHRETRLTTLEASLLPLAAPVARARLLEGVKRLMVVSMLVSMLVQGLRRPKSAPGLVTATVTTVIAVIAVMTRITLRTAAVKRTGDITRIPTREVLPGPQQRRSLYPLFASDRAFHTR